MTNPAPDASYEKYLKYARPEGEILRSATSIDSGEIVPMELHYKRAHNDDARSVELTATILNDGVSVEAPNFFDAVHELRSSLEHLGYIPNIQGAKPLIVPRGNQNVVGEGINVLDVTRLIGGVYVEVSILDPADTTEVSLLADSDPLFLAFVDIELADGSRGVDEVRSLASQVPRPWLTET